MKKSILFLSILFATVAMAQESPNNGFMPSRVTATERDAFTNPAKGLIIFNTTANTLQINTGTDAAPTWETIGTLSGGTSYGDVKTGAQPADHSGWIKLDGRAVSTLTATQQTQATALGYTTNLPDATNAYLVQHTSLLGSVAGANTKNIAQNNLPNATLNGTTNSTGDHSHTNNSSSANGGWGLVRVSNGESVTGASHDTNPGEIDILTRPAAVTINSGGAHTHTYTTTSINGGVTQQPFDVTPKSMSVNTFIFLGN